MPDDPAVISNTSPLLYLHRIGQLDLLARLYGELLVPREVAAELDAGMPDAPDVRKLEWVRIREVRVPEALRLVPDLGAGETTAIALTLQEGPAGLLLLDDRLGRRIAALQGLRVTGTAGVLMRAKQRGLIPALRPLLEGLIRSGFYLRAEHMETICGIAGEEDA